ncbi:hypothetical protein WH221_20005 [Chryseobacterium culicis]|uniref:Tetratricopeptide repeat-containing protein n=1 Tax=Chryseobacterium culicis TaxID=680127 RepID=A0A2S9CKQ6_CHRCI|nr:hypothetical protein [Chryseobacterium culicis]PRB81080.1 hypothetical protein CQ022_19935 [Chryseobacterium culicis]PRB88016.1 hypothetical protein CQ033_18840 [Chryseobacterium culicis]
MNPRVLELIKNPKNIQSEDLGLLKEEIHTFPYIQNIRALHLYGVHLYEKENYQKELSTTAAYTTDKKILYQLINGKIKPEVVKEKKPSKTTEKAAQFIPKTQSFPIRREEEISLEKPSEEQENTCVIPAAQEVKHIYVNGERNRILFEGEENFLDEQNSETIDIESTLESGTLVTQKTEPVVEEPIQQEEKQTEIEEKAGEDFTPETIIDEDQISSEKEEEKVDEEENISFHEVSPLASEESIEEVTEEPLNTRSTDIEAISVSEEEIAQQEIQTEVEDNAGENFTPETIIDEDQISAEKEEANSNEEESSIEISDAEVSFHGTDSFMPDVKIQANNEETLETVEISQPNVNKHEEEMRRLIEEVEKKMKETKPVLQEEVEPEVVEDHEISFADTQNFHFWSTSEDKPEETKEESLPEEVVESQLPVEEAKVEITEEKEEETPGVQSVWKPMSVESNMPDSLISKSEKGSAPEIKIPVAEAAPVAEPEAIIEEQQPSETVTATVQEEALPVSEMSENEENHSVLIESTEEEKTDTENGKEDVPVMNVSFFGTDISTLKVEEKQKEKKEEPVEKTEEVTMKNTAQSSIDSNVPGFINTWQSWLKIGRTEENEKEKLEIKDKAIETFIENNPRISQLKEESTYVVKEKNDDISHLMTETLANLYFEQKLYTKAIKAFEILIKKSPEKKEYFESKIKDIKDFRSKN